MTYGNGTVILPIMRRAFIGALVGIYTYTAFEVVLIPGYAQLCQKFKQFGWNVALWTLLLVLRCRNQQLHRRVQLVEVIEASQHQQFPLRCCSKVPHSQNGASSRSRTRGAPSSAGADHYMLEDDESPFLFASSPISPME